MPHALAALQAKGDAFVSSRQPAPKPPPRARGKSSLKSSGHDLENLMALYDAREQRWAQYEAEWAAYAEKSREFDDICKKIETLTRDVDEAHAAWQAAEAVAEGARKVAEVARKQQIALLERQLEEVEALQREINAPKRAALLAAAEKAWGPDHATRKASGYFDLRGPLPPSPPPSPPASLLHPGPVLAS